MVRFVDNRNEVEKRIESLFVKGFKKIVIHNGKEVKVETSNRKVSIISEGKVLRTYQRNEVGVANLLGEAKADGLAKAIVDVLRK